MKKVKAGDKFTIHSENWTFPGLWRAISDTDAAVFSHFAASPDLETRIAGHTFSPNEAYTFRMDNNTWIVDEGVELRGAESYPGDGSGPSLSVQRERCITFLQMAFEEFIGSNMTSKEAAELTYDTLFDKMQIQPPEM